jgi:DNA-binding NtrC family response regulator
MKFLTPTLAELERKHILAVLRDCEGNRSRSAKLLDISVRCLRNKLRQYRAEGVTVPKSNSGGTAKRAGFRSEPVLLPACF